MRGPKTALIAGLVVTATAATATILNAQQRFAGPGRATASSDASLSQRSARMLLKNGLSYLNEYGDFDRALVFLREAQRRPAGLDEAEIKSLADALDRAERARSEAVPAVASSRSLPPSPRRVDLAAAPVVDSPVRKASTERVEPDEPPAMDLPALPPPRSDEPPAPKAAATKTAAEPIYLTGSSPDDAPPAPKAAAPVPVPVPVPTDGPAPLDAPDGPAPAPVLPTAAPDLPPPSDVPAPVEPKVASPKPVADAPPPVDAPAPAEVPATEAPAPAPIGSPRPIAAPVARRFAPAAAAAAPAVEPAPVPAPAAEDLPPLPGSDAVAAPAPLSPISGLSPESRRIIEEIARRQDEALRKNPPPMLGQVVPPNAAAGGPTETGPVSRLEIPRPPSPTEPRPIRVIPVPEEFVPLPPRKWEPNRKFWAASATCHMPLYFQDAVLERYGQGVEQAIGPNGRYFSYPLDDPRQTNQRNQLLQPMYSAGMFLTQIALLPYNMLVDPPWEAHYDLGFYRPGDKVPGDTYYLPKFGIGPPLRGNRY